MKVTYHIEARDMWALYAYAQKHLPTNRIVRIAGNVLMAIFSIAIAATTDASEVKHPLLTKAIFAGIIFGILFGVMKFLNFIVLRITLWRVCSSDKNRGVLGEHTITLTEEAMIEATAVNEGKNLWKGIYQLREDSRYIYIFVTSSQAHIIPKRAFPSVGEAALFLQEAKRLHSNALAS